MLITHYFQDTPPLRLLSCHCIVTETGRLFILAFNKQIKCLKSPQICIDGQKYTGDLANFKERHNLVTFEVAAAGIEFRFDIDPNSFEDGLRQRLPATSVHFKSSEENATSLEICNMERTDTKDSLTHCLPVEYWEKELESVKELLDLEPGCKCKAKLFESHSLEDLFF
jgi:hypothetical protein